MAAPYADASVGRCSSDGRRGKTALDGLRLIYLTKNSSGTL